MAIETLNIEDLDRNGLQTRVALDEATVVEYSEAMRSKAHFPPVTAFCDGTRIYLADGFHRVEATLRCGWKKIKADVRAGSFADALKHALGANANHGLRRTNADKQRCLRLAWENRAILFGRDDADPSAEILADACGVSLNMASIWVKNQPTQNVYVDNSKTSQNRLPPPQRRVFGKDGKTRTITMKPPMPTPSSPLPMPPPQRDIEGKVVKPGYHIAEDGKVHAIGVKLDRFGVEIPDEIVKAFTSADLDKFISDVFRIKTRLNNALGNKDIALAAVSQRAYLELDNAYHELKAAKAYCVCRMCQGGGCDACRSTGFQTEDQYKRNLKEFKA